MYLISIYFDEASEKRIKSYMKQIGKATGNTVMLDGNVPPHTTIAAFYTESEEDAREIFWKGANNLKAGGVQWVAVGMFLPSVIYIAPILNEYLQELSEIYNKEATGRQGVTVDHKYLPYGWMPHSTLAKRLSKEQLMAAFSVMQNQFGPFCGKVTKIGLAKTNPYTELEVLNLK